MALFYPIQTYSPVNERFVCLAGSRVQSSPAAAIAQFSGPVEPIAPWNSTLGSMGCSSCQVRLSTIGTSDLVLQWYRLGRDRKLEGKSLTFSVRGREQRSKSSLTKGRSRSINI